MIEVVPLRYGTAFKKAFGEPLAFSALVKAAIGIDFMPERVEQEYALPTPVSGVNIAYDLFAEDTARRTIVELQHVRESSTYDRFLYYHCVGLVEQIVSSKRYVFDRDVYTLVVFTRWPDDPVLQYGRATCDLDPVTEEGQRLGVYRHRLVFLNARAPKERLPEAVRPLVALIEDTLDGQVDETRYQDEVSQQILSRIQWTHLTPDENAQVKDEGTWEAAKQEEQQKGLAMGRAMGRTEELRTSIADLCEVCGISLTEARTAEIAALDLRGLEELRAAIKARKTWPR